MLGLGTSLLSEYKYELIYHAGAMETLVGLYEIVDFFKITKDPTNVHDNKYHPQPYLQDNGHTHTHTHTYIVHIQG